MRQLSPEFMHTLTDGHLNCLRERCADDPDLDLFLRGDYVSVYFKGASLVKVYGPQEGFALDWGTNPYTQQLPSGPARLGNIVETDTFLKLIPLIKEQVWNVGKRGAFEIEYEQLLIRSNNRHGHKGVTTEYFIVDRQYALGCRDGNRVQLDMVAVCWPSHDKRPRRGNDTVVPVVIEYKYGLNPDIKNVHEQLKRYHEHLEKEWDDFTEDLQNLLVQRSELGLFGEESKKVHDLKVIREFKQLEFLVALADYNPNSMNHPAAELGRLPFAERIRIASCGFGLWKQNLPKPSEYLRP